MIKAVCREEWPEVHELRGELEEAGLKPPHVREVSTERENTFRELRKFLKVTRGTTQICCSRATNPQRRRSANCGQLSSERSTR